MRVQLAESSGQFRGTLLYYTSLEAKLTTGCMNQIWLYNDSVIQLVGHARSKTLTNQVSSSCRSGGYDEHLAREMDDSALKEHEMLKDSFKLFGRMINK